jgi:competence ComEA-like helix-hairpin-helix protein
MRVIEGQRWGATLFLVASIVIYSTTLFRHQGPFAQPHMPWGEQTAETAAIEIVMGGKGDGIYFSPAKEGLWPLFQKNGPLEEIGDKDWYRKPLPSSLALSVAVDGEAVKFTDMAAVKRLALGLPIDLNAASIVELSLVPGIGLSTATRIVEWRQAKGKFQTLSDLKKVPGIKDNRLKSLEPYLQVSVGR